MAQRILRPLEYGDLLDEMFDLLKSNFLLFVGIAAIIEIPLNVIIYSVFTNAQQTSSLLMLPAAFFVMAASTWAVSRTYLGKEATILGSYQAIVGRLIPLILTLIIAYLVICVGLVLLIIPGIIFSLWFSIVTAVLVVEGKSSVKALERSKELTGGHLGRIFTVLFLCGIINIIISGILTWPLAFITGGAGTFFGLISGIASALTTPISVIPIVLLYYDLRVRKEGYDLELLAADMGETVTQTPAPQEPTRPL